MEATGPGGRITSEDVERAAAAVTASAAAPRTEVVELADGTKIAALLAGPPDATETIVFLHGLGGSQSTWASVLGAFAETYRIAAVDLPGHGASDKPSPESTDYSIPGIAAKIGELLEKLELAPPSSSATLSAARRHCSWRSTVQSSSAGWHWSIAPLSGWRSTANCWTGSNPRPRVTRRDGCSSYFSRIGGSSSNAASTTCTLLAMRQALTTR